MAKREKLHSSWITKSFVLLTSFLLALCLLIPAMSTADEIPRDERGWVDFLLVCNEGMNNSGGNAGNTVMVITMNPDTGEIRMMMMTWDTFIRYEGYDVLQKIDMPYRNNGPEETLKVFNDNFNMDIKLFMSLNYLNLSSLIDAYDGITVNVSRAERNALNGLVASKKEAIQSQAGLGLVSQMLIDNLADEYYLTEYGPDTRLNGMQAVGFGWLQYDSVYNCCLREVEVIAALFKSVGQDFADKVIFYTDESGYPEFVNARRPINLDNMTDEDITYLRREMSPIFQMAYHNLSEEDILSISMALARTAYLASRQGANIFDSLKYKVFPVEATQEYDIVAGTKGHIIDYAKNEEAIKAFLFGENDD